MDIPHPFEGNFSHQERVQRTLARAWCPTVEWVLPVDFNDLQAAGASQTTTLQIPSSGFASSEIAMTFSGGPLGTSTVEVTQTASASASNTAFAQIIDNAIEAESALDDYVAATAATDTVTMDFTDGQGLIEVAVAVDMAQRTTVTFGGTIIDGDYSSIISGGGLGSPVTVTTTRTGGTPSTATAMAVQHEADIEALIASTLAGVVQNANDDGAGVNSILMEPGIADVTVTTSPPRQTFTATVGGTASDGVYSFRINHASLPGGFQLVEFDRGGGESNTGIADGLEASAEGNGALSVYIDNADNSAAVVTITSHTGVTGLSVSDATAPGSGTLTLADTSPTMAVADATPATYTPVLTHSVTLTASAHRTGFSFPTNMWRMPGAYVYVAEAFASGTTVDVGDDDLDGVLDGVDVTSAGYPTNTLGTEGGYAVPESAYAPTVTFVIPTATPSAGRLYVAIPMAPLPVNRPA